MDSNPSENLTDQDHESAPSAAGDESAPQWRSRSRSGRGSSRRGRERDRSRGKSGNARGKRLTAQQRAERFMVVVSFFLGLCVAGFAGFVIGRKTQVKDQGEAMAMTAEIAPSIQSEEKLDAAFSDLRLGNAKKALLGFQDVQSSQPGLYGIDFLVGYAAHFAGEPAFARESFQTAIGKKELEEEATAILSLDDVTKRESGAGAPAIADPVATAETALRHYASRRPLDPRAYYLCAEMLRSKGSYRTAGELMAKALGRTDPRFDPRLIEAKMVLSRLQNEPPKEAVSISSVTSLDGAGALSAAYAALVNKKSDEGVLFLERASEFYPGILFTELMQDQAFDEFRTDSKFGEFLKKH